MRQFLRMVDDKMHSKYPTFAMDMRKSYLIFLFSTLLVACSEQPNNEKNQNNNNLADSLQALNQRIMDIHDDAMQYNAYLLKLKRMINQKLDSLSNQPGISDSLKIISAKLYLADRKMLDWMHGYKTPDYSKDSAISYLNLQKKLIDEVHQLTFDAIFAAENALQIPSAIKQTKPKN